MKKLRRVSICRPPPCRLRLAARGACRRGSRRSGLDRIVVRRNRGAVPSDHVNQSYYKRVEQIHRVGGSTPERSEEHTSELQSLMRKSYAVFCLIKKNNMKRQTNTKTDKLEQ